MSTPSPIIDAERRCAPPVKEISAISIQRPSMLTLDNGAVLHTYSGCSSPVCYLSVVTPGGQAEAGQPALSALAANMQREGSEHYSGEEIAAVLDFNGAWMRSTAHAHHTQHSLFAMNSTLDKVLPVWLDSVMRPAFPDKVLEVRRNAMAQNIAVSQTDVNYLARCANDKSIMGPGHPLAAEDSPEAVAAITATDLAEFHASRGRMEVFLCGEITPEVERTVINNFNELSAGSHSRLNLQPYRPEAPGTATIHRADAAQSAVMISLPAIPRTHPDYLALHLTVLALGGYFGSRLMLNIREEKGLTYGIAASLLGNIDDAHTLIQADTDPRHAARLIDEVSAELRRLVSNPPRGEELRRLRQSALSTHASTLDSCFSIIEHYITELTTGLPGGYFDAKQQAIARLTPEIIAETACKYLNPEQLRITVAGQ